MLWNPEKYNQFKNIRYQPFFDLMEMISPENLNIGIDIGCGTGEQTSFLAEKFANAEFLGIDPSDEMLAKSKEFELKNLHFQKGTVEELVKTNKKWDLVFSNAALQWSDNHAELFPSIIELVGKKGQFAVQIPVQNENILNRILLELVQEKPFSDYLKNWKRESTVLSIDDYAQIMFDGGLRNIEIIQKIYPIIADDTEKLFDFISGSALIPYIERLSEEQQAEFLSAYKTRIGKSFPKFPAIYAFKRLLLYGKKYHS